MDLDGLTLQGRSMAKLRHEVSRARRQGVIVQVLPETALTEQTRRAMKALDTNWSRGRALGEMAFSVGRPGDSPPLPTTVGLAHDSAGRLVGYTTWYALPGVGGLVLDGFRRHPYAPGGAMQLLLYRVMADPSHRCAWASLGLAPAAGPSAQSLGAFKSKFQPRWEPRHMVVEQLRNWPGAALATLLLHYPELARLPERLVPIGLRPPRLHREPRPQGRR